MFDPGILLLIGLAYLSVLAAIAWASDTGKIAERVASHPATYSLSLGVLAGSWAFFGSASVAADYGYGFLGFFIGTGSLYLFAPLLLIPLMHICYQHQLSSVPDLLAFRFRGRYTGAVITVAQVLACIPLIAFQIKLVIAVVSIIGGVTPSVNANTILALGFGIGMTVFAILFGVRSISPGERHNGLVVAMALETAIKLVGFFVLGLWAIYEVFGSPADIRAWLTTRPDILEQLSVSVNSPSSYALTMTFMVSALSLPQLFFTGIYETPRTSSIRQSTWTVPFLLIAVAVPVLPILWAGYKLGIAGEPALFLPKIALELGPVAAMLAFMIAFSAASSSIIMIVLALAGSVTNNLLLPLYPSAGGQITRHLKQQRSAVIAVIMLVTVLVSVRLVEQDSLMHVGFSAFIGLAQFIPGLAALLYWPRANRAGLFAGLATGMGIWLAFVFDHSVHESLVSHPVLNIIEGNVWASEAIASVGMNALVLVVVSLLTKRSKEERDAAINCSIDTFTGRSRRQLKVSSAREFPEALARSIGSRHSDRVFRRALADMGIDENENRPGALYILRQRVEAQLTRILGAQMAMDVVERELPTDDSDASQKEDIYQLEIRADNLRDSNLAGLAADLDALRRFYREALKELPVGICGINADNEIVMWNRTLAVMTDVSDTRALGSNLDQLPRPWPRLLRKFIDSGEQHEHAVKVNLKGQSHWITLHRSDPMLSDLATRDIRFIVLEDVTETQLLQDELIHSERLASIGRLAAGVAHEIGNPVTAIDCLAQNLAAESDDASVREEALAIIGQTHRIGDIVQTLVNFAHSGANQRGMTEVCNVAELADEAIYFIGLGRDLKEVNFRNECDRHVRIESEPQRLMQVFINLLSNARDASDEFGTITIYSSSTAAGVLINVVDEGCGIPASQIDNIYEPFYTTKAPGEGTGLGLSLVYSIIRDLGGEISARSPVDTERKRGTEMSIRLPFSVRSDQI